MDERAAVVLREDREVSLCSKRQEGKGEERWGTKAGRAAPAR